MNVTAFLVGAMLLASPVLSNDLLDAAEDLVLQYDECTALLNQIDYYSLNEYEKTRYYVIKGYTNYKHGLHHNGLLLYHAAIYHAHKSEKNTEYFKLTSYNNIGQIHRKSHNFDKAINFFNEALKQCDKPGIEKPDQWKSLIHRNLGITYNELDNHVAAAENFMISSRFGDQYTVKNINSLGLAYFYNSEYDSAGSKFQKVIEDEKAKPLYKGRALHNLANVYLKTSQTKKAISIFQILASEPSYEHLFLSSMDLGSHYLEINLLDSALYYLKIAESNIPERLDPDHYKVYDDLRLVCVKTNKIDEFFRYDSLFRDSNNAFLAMSKENYNVTQQSSIAFAEDELKKTFLYAETKRENDRLTYLGGGAVSLLILIFLYLGRKYHLAEKLKAKNAKYLNKVRERHPI